jgi:hypothetical protein
VSPSEANPQTPNPAVGYGALSGIRLSMHLDTMESGGRIAQMTRFTQSTPCGRVERIVALGLVAALAPGVSCDPRTPSAHPATTGAAFHYEIVAGGGARELSVVADFAPGSSDEFTIDPRTAPFVRDVSVQSTSGWASAASRDGAWRVDGCAANGCRVRYRFLLGEAASALGSPDEAIAVGASLEAPPSSWLVAPTRIANGSTFVFHVTPPSGWSFVAGTWSVDGAADSYRGAATDVDDNPYAAFGPFHPRAIDGAPVTLVIARGTTTSSVSDDAIAAWVGRAAHAVTSYYGRFPVSRVPIFVATSDGEGVRRGETSGGGGAAIAIQVGEHTTSSMFDSDWELVHEMIHTALPQLLRQYHWLEEGLPTYVEPLARARVGLITPEQAWGGMVNGMSQGEPEEGDQGLDRTPTWGRTYWGGAMFCLLADVAIRERTGNRKSLDDALRGILASGGSIAVEWPIERVLAAGDEAVGIPVLRELHDRLGSLAVHEDLDALFARLGVRKAGDYAAFDDAAPLAAIRRSMTAPR